MAITLQMTISGIDGGGFAFQNVFHIQSESGVGTDFEVMNAANLMVVTDIIPVYQDAAVDEYHFLDVAAKIIDPNPSYTVHDPIDVVGSRVGDQAMGAIAAMISFYPSGGSHIGRIFVVGSNTSDWANDFVVPAYFTLLNALGDAFIAIDGSAPTYAWQFGIWNKSTPAFLPVTHYVTSGRPTTLTKRMRA